MENKIEGKRFNQGKLRYDLLHPKAVKGLVQVLTKGAEKYDERNWEKGMKWTTVIASLKRHLAAIEEGQDYDKETGLLHADHLQCNAHFLSAYYSIAQKYDDRNHSYMNQKRVGLDIDDTIAIFLPDWCNYWKYDIPHHWYFDRTITDKFEQMRKEGKLEDFYLNLKPSVDPKSLPFETVCYVTSRPCSVETTMKWLDNNGFPQREVLAVDVNHTKVDKIKEADLDYFIDDKFENFLEINKNTDTVCLLMDAPHNQRYDVGYRRIKDFNDFKERFL